MTSPSSLPEYRELSAPETRSVSDLQRSRRLETDALARIDWDLKRDALKASGLVQERKALRDQAAD
jgi:hypothetical protein